MLRAKLIEELKEHVPNSMTFNVGYFEGRKHDLKVMYSKYPSSDITIWCDGWQDESIRGKRKRDDSSVSSLKHKEREEEVDDIFSELKEKHSDNYGNPKLHLWAQMISSNLHDSLEDPPNIPVFQASTPKRQKTSDSITSAINGAAVALANVLKGDVTSSSEQAILSSTEKVVDLRRKNLNNFNLSKTFSKKEFEEQKSTIINGIRML